MEILILIIKFCAIITVPVLLLTMRYDIDVMKILTIAMMIGLLSMLGITFIDIFNHI